ncbi:hypothetical protein [Flavobacterium sp. 3HN19-14]|uniref:hypothetical protein n=1 Tax=Flavobacterium sp. 3HN19-14 TaxID=3448133 RepID=UPI003EDEC8F7
MLGLFDCIVGQRYFCINRLFYFKCLSNDGFDLKVAVETMDAVMHRTIPISDDELYTIKLANER